jgi:hypothetical protein
VTRVDLAADYDLPPESIHFEVRYARKYTVITSHRGIETQYAGDRRSAWYCCIYNKEIEVREQGRVRLRRPLRADWTRIEVRRKFSPAIRLVDLPDIENPYTRLTFFDMREVPLGFPDNLLALAVRTGGMGYARALCQDRVRFREFTRRLLKLDAMGADPGPVELFEVHGRSALKAFIKSLRHA